MSIFVPNKVYLRGILLHYFIQKKSAAEAHRILVQTYGDNALSDTTCRDWFRGFKNNDFELEDKERSGAPKKFEDKELEQSLDEDPSQTLSELGKILQVDESTVSKRLKGLGMIQKQGHWVPYELKPRDVERRFGTCELLLQRQKRKGFLPHQLSRGGGEGEILDLPPRYADRGSPTQEGHHGGPHLEGPGPGEPRQSLQTGLYCRPGASSVIGVWRPVTCSRGARARLTNPGRAIGAGASATRRVSAAEKSIAPHAVGSAAPRGTGCAAAKAKGRKGGQKPSGPPATTVAGQTPAAATTVEASSAVPDVEMAVVAEVTTAAAKGVANGAKRRADDSHIDGGGVHSSRVGTHSPDPHGAGDHSRGGVTKTPPTREGTSMGSAQLWSPLKRKPCSSTMGRAGCPLRHI
ncbi:MOS1T transposase, partial [Pseudoatta argentina]